MPQVLPTSSAAEGERGGGSQQSGRRRQQHTATKLQDPPSGQRVWFLITCRQASRRAQEQNISTLLPRGQAARHGGTCVCRKSAAALTHCGRQRCQRQQHQGSVCPHGCASVSRGVPVLFAGSSRSSLSSELAALQVRCCSRGDHRIGSNLRAWLPPQAFMHAGRGGERQLGGRFVRTPWACKTGAAYSQKHAF